MRILHVRNPCECVIFWDTLSLGFLLFSHFNSLTTGPHQYVYFCIFLNLRTTCSFSMALSLHAFASVQEQVVINHEPSALSQLSHFSDFLVIYLSIRNNKLQQPCTWPQHLGYTSIVSACYTGPFSVPRLVRVDALQN